MTSFYKPVAQRLDLAQALQNAAPNDLLPPREEDRIAGELSKRFLAHLQKTLEDDRYAPDPASIVQVPKPGLTSRPAALLTLTDRVIYEALVHLVRNRLERYLLDADVVMWPRATYQPKRWSEFEWAPTKANLDHIVLADISGFYDSIDHDQLSDLIVHATGEREAASAIHQFLSQVMRSRRGLPQGLPPSDSLATAFLRSLDANLIREGYQYVRHGDDMRVAAENKSRARKAIAIIESTLRELGLLLNGAKCQILKRKEYLADLEAADALMEQTRKKLLAQRISRLEEDDEALIEKMREAELDEQWGWDLFYHGTISVQDVISVLREHLEPSDIEVAASLFKKTMAAAPGRTKGTKGLTPERFHQQITRSLVRLAAGRSPAALKHSARLIAWYPEKTELVTSYLMAMQRSHLKQTVQQIENIVGSDLFVTPWQLAWLLRALVPGARYASAQVKEKLLKIARSESEHWLSRVEAMKVIGRLGKLEQSLLSQSWKLAPKPYRCDLLVAAAYMDKSADWPQRFLAAARQDPVEAVVVQHLAGSD